MVARRTGPIDRWQVSNLMINFNVNKAKTVIDISQQFNREGIHSQANGHVPPVVHESLMTDPQHSPQPLRDSLALLTY